MRVRTRPRSSLQRRRLTSRTVARGFFTQGQGNPDESRASRYILKDYVSGKLLYGHPPPDAVLSAADFNAESRDLDRLRLLDRVRAKRAPTTRVGKDSDTYLHQNNPSALPIRPAEGRKATRLDETFFAEAGARDRPIVMGVGAKASANTARASLLPNGEPALGNGKKHHKANKRQKQRSGAGYD
jgi:large subunit GTPase 1